MSHLYPAFRYHDPKAAVDFLCRAFGFEKHQVYEDDTGGVAHAELKLGRAMIMLGGVRDDVFGRAIGTPRTQGLPTSCTYVSVADADAHHARAVAAGAKVVLPLQDKPYGSREYVCTDLEGHLWSFGTYDPLA